MRTELDTGHLLSAGAAVTVRARVARRRTLEDAMVCWQKLNSVTFFLTGCFFPFFPLFFTFFGFIGGHNHVAPALHQTGTCL